MGKYTLLIVLAAILGGSMLTLNMRLTSGLTDRNRSEGQASLLARQIAESGQGVALSLAQSEAGFLTDADFFSAFGAGPKAYNGGFYQADSFRSFDSGRRAELVISGVYGQPARARHVLTSSYEFDPMTYPGPIWLDVPYATASGGGSSKIDGRIRAGTTDINLNAHVDQTKFNELAGLLDLGAMKSSLESAISGTTVKFSNGLKGVQQDAALLPSDATGTETGLLADLNVDNAEDLYQAALSAKTAGDRTIASSTISSSVTWSGTSTITHVTSPLTIRSGGRVDGEGVLLVDGGLVVENGGRLDWEGLVIVRSVEDKLRVEFIGQTRIRGGLVVNQETAPQVGHMDATVLRSMTGNWTNAWGEYGPKDGPSRPWYMHTHKFDALGSVRVSEAQRVARFVHAGAASLNQDARLVFQQTLDALGSDDVQIRFKNADAHGHAVYDLQLTGEDKATGTVRTGFPETLSEGTVHTTRAFPANELEAFTVDVRSLPALKRLWDTEPGCDQPTWPQCVGRRPQRGGALTVQILHKAKPVYEAALYWHVRTDEWPDHQAKMDAWRAKVIADKSFGTHLDLSKADIAVDLPNIVELADRLGFAGNRIVLLGVTARHVSASEARSRTSVEPDAGTTVCHKPGTPAQQTMTLAPNAVAAHLAHGDTAGGC